MPWNGKYDPSEMLKVASVSCFEGESYTNLDNCVTDILATIVVSKTKEELYSSLQKILLEYGRISIGKCLNHLNNIADDEPSLKFGRTGLDALTYHLSSHSCEKGIQALQKVLEHFKKGY